MLRYGATLCSGARSAINPSRPAALCMQCERRTTTPQHVWQKFLEPPPARHDGARWACEMRVSAAAVPA